MSYVGNSNSLWHKVHFQTRWTSKETSPSVYTMNYGHMHYAAAYVTATNCN